MVVGGGSERRLALQQAGEVQSREQPGGRRLGVSLDPRELTREQQGRVVPGGEVRRQGRGRVEVGVAVHAAVAQELGGPESGDGPEHPLLLARAQPRLEADQVPHLPGPVLPAQLHDGVRQAPGARIGQARRASSARSAARRGRAGPSPRPAGSPRRRACDRIRATARTGPRATRASTNASYCASVQRRVQVVVAAALAVAGGPEQDIVVERIVRDDGRDGVEEGERGRAESLRDRATQPART